MKILTMVFIISLSVYANIAKVTALKGDVRFQRDGAIVKAKLGDKVKKSDIIKTGSKSRVQIIFKDNTIISAGAKSTLKVEDYLFKTGEKPKASFGFKKGTFKTISGKIAKLNPTRFKMKTKTASMGIRGTIVGLELSEEEEIYMVLEGKIVVWTDDDREVEINRGQMVRKQRDRPLSRKKEVISKKKRERFEKRSGARENEEESGAGEKTQTKEVTSSEKCNYR